MAVNDLLTPAEAREAVSLKPTDTAHDDELQRWITGISTRIDKLCGPVVIRTVTNETHDGGTRTIWLRDTPVSSITSVVEYVHTTATTLTAETNASKPADGYLPILEGHRAKLLRRNAGADATFASGRQNVVVTYEAGRAASTSAVDALFKTAASSILRRLWAREAPSWARVGGGFDDDLTTGVGFFKAVDPMITEFLSHELTPPALA